MQAVRFSGVVWNIECFQVILCITVVSLISRGQAYKVKSKHRGKKSSHIVEVEAPKRPGYINFGRMSTGYNNYCQRAHAP